MLTIPVDPVFYAQFRIVAARQNLTIAAYARQWLEKAVEQSNLQDVRDVEQQKLINGKS